MRIVGVVGGIASGKTMVATELERLGAVVLNADRAGHAVLDEQAVRQALIERWGRGVLTPDGTVDRQAVARIVFAASPAGPKELEFLEALTHPRIRILLERQISQLAKRGTPVAVLDAPVMLKAKWDQFCDQIVFVAAPREVRVARGLARGWSEAEFDRREAAQMPLDVKRARAERVVDNSGSATAMRRQVEQLWRELVA
jgi:dephospho-CoA kinase